jgi:hypothetical protein
MVEFYFHFFDLIKEDLLALVERVRTRGRLVGSLNSTFIALIPKLNKPLGFGDYKPISLCNLIYKIISKVIANRIKSFLSRALSPEQFGFLEWCQIHDVIGTAHECIHSIKKKNQKALILKLDLQKAYNYVNWDSLRLILIQGGFGVLVTNWIMSCMNSTSFVVLVNGEATNFFKSGCGLRHSCPLSPLLFILVMESLSLLIKSRQRDGSLTGIEVSRLTKILHLLFVDDILILTRALVQEWTVIMELIICFCMASGLKVNSTKSTVHYLGLLETKLDVFKIFIPYSFSDLTEGFKYLGYYLKDGIQKSKDWSWLIQKVEKKIRHWSYRWLSLGGRFTLCKAVLESQPIYWFSLASIPLSILHKLRNLLYNFLWNGNVDTNHFHLCHWETLARPKRMGVGDY